MKNYIYLLAVSLCMGLAACGDDDDENNGVVPPVTNNNQNNQNDNTQQTLPDPEGTVTARITNDGVPENGIKISYSYVYMDRVNNLCVKSDGSQWTPSIISFGKVAGLAAITKVPEEGYSDKVATSEGDGFVIRDYGFRGYGISPGQAPVTIYAYSTLCRMYLDAYIRDAQGNIIGATLKYQTGGDWVEKDGE